MSSKQNEVLSSIDVFKLESFKALCEDLGIDTKNTLSLTIRLSLDDACTYEQERYASRESE